MRSKESISLQLLRTLEEVMIQHPQHDLLNVYVTASIAFYLLSEKRAHLSDIEKTFKTVIKIFQDEDLGGSLFHLKSADGANLLAPPVDTTAGPAQDSKRHKKRRDNKGHTHGRIVATEGASTPEGTPQEGGEQQPSGQPNAQPSEGGEKRNKRNRNRRRFRNNREPRPQGDSADQGQPSVASEEAAREPNGNRVRDPNDVNDIDDNIGNSITRSEDDLPTTAKKPRGQGQRQGNGWWKRLLDN